MWIITEMYGIIRVPFLLFFLVLTEDVSNIPSQFGFQIGFLSPFDGSGFLRFPTPSTDQLSRYNEWVLEYGPVGGVSQTIRIPVGDSFRTLTDLTEDTLYMFNLNLDGPSGPSPRTIPYTRRTPIGKCNILADHASVYAFHAHMHFLTLKTFEYPYS